MSAIEELAPADYQPLEAAPEPDTLAISVDPFSLSVNILDQLRALGLPTATEVLDSPKEPAQVIDITDLLPAPKTAKPDSPAPEAAAEPEGRLSSDVIKTLKQAGDGSREALAKHRPVAARESFKHGGPQELSLISSAQNGDQQAFERLIRNYLNFVRLKASSYFLQGGETDDVLQEGLVGFYKAVRDYDASKGASFRSFAELCVQRQIITAVKTATRFKHSPLNKYVSFSHNPDGTDPDDLTLGDALPGPAAQEPPAIVISTEELQSLVYSLGTGLSNLESDSLRLYLEDNSYEDMAEELNCDTKTIDNALQRVKRKIIAHQKEREVLL